jgi:hypothetical protein
MSDAIVAIGPGSIALTGARPSWTGMAVSHRLV